jgi:hypothetical protein
MLLNSVILNLNRMNRFPAKGFGRVGLFLGLFKKTKPVHVILEVFRRDAVELPNFLTNGLAQWGHSTASGPTGAVRAVAE